jgi:hypothetical protein
MLLAATPAQLRVKANRVPRAFEAYWGVMFMRRQNQLISRATDFGQDLKDGRYRP